MTKIYLFDIKKIDYAFVDEELETIEFTLFKNYPIFDTSLMMNISTIMKFKQTIEDMLELKEKKEKLRKNKQK